VLRAAGFEVFLAPDYRLTLEDLESTRPIDLLITDIVMPARVNGVALGTQSYLPHRLRHSRSRGRRDWPRLAQADRRRSPRGKGKARSGDRLTPERDLFLLSFRC
jgi:hypothetical protein